MMIKGTVNLKPYILCALLFILSPVFGLYSQNNTNHGSSPNNPVSVELIRFGSSYNGEDLLAYRIGNSGSGKLIVGGIHGGYEYNTVITVKHIFWQLIEDFEETEEPEDTVYIIPCLNPDGYSLEADTLAARMNGNGVDLNRNWNYNWSSTAEMGNRSVDPGSFPFSEPETQALRDFVQENEIHAVIIYHSAMGTIFAGADRKASASYELAELASNITRYAYLESGMPGQRTTGDAVDWMSVQGIAAIEIELSSHIPIGDEETQRNIQLARAFVDWEVPEERTIPDRLSSLDGNYSVYTVRSGDTLWDIARAHDISIYHIIDVNNITTDTTLFVGQELYIPEVEAFFFQGQ
ncbi:MAG: M14 family zinc carboxypeptidase [Spirochaetia bacterium]